MNINIPALNCVTVCCAPKMWGDRLNRIFFLLPPHGFFLFDIWNEFRKGESIEIVHELFSEL